MAADLFHLAPQIEEQVHRVAALIHQGAAAVHGPGAPPRGALVVGFVPEPELLGRDRHQFPEPAFVEGLADGRHRLLEAGLEDRRQQHLVLVGDADHVVDLGEGDVEGLFAEDVLASLRRGHHGVVMEAAGRGHGHRFEPGRL